MTYTNEFEVWRNSLSEHEQDDVVATVALLEDKGPMLPFPYSSGIESSTHSHMREFRIQHAGRPYLVLYAFDPRRFAILLSGEIRPATTVGMTNLFLLLMLCMISILKTLKRKVK